MVAYNYSDITTFLLSGKNEAERRREEEELARRRGQSLTAIGGIMKTKDQGYIQLAGIRAKGLDTLKQRLNVKDLDNESLRRFVETMTRDEAVNFFVEVGLPVAPVLYASDAVKDPQILSRNMFVEVQHPKLGKIKVINFPVKFSEAPGEVVSAAPLLGQHNKQVLANYLGYTEEEIAELTKEGVIASERLS